MAHINFFHCEKSLTKNYEGKGSSKKQYLLKLLTDLNFNVFLSEYK